MRICEGRRRWFRRGRQLMMIWSWRLEESHGAVGALRSCGRTAIGGGGCEAAHWLSSDLGRVSGDSQLWIRHVEELWLQIR